MRTLCATAAAALALTVAACGGGDPNPASSGTDGGRQGIDAKTKKAMLDFARCMREHGIDMKDPQFQPGGGVVMQAGAKGTTAEQQRAAEQACAKYQKQIKPPAGANSPAAQAKFRKAALANAKCMREHGINMPDPQFGENGEVQQRIGPGIRPTDPKFQAAQKACGRAGMIGGGPGGSAP
jgi:hypothetical protein